MPHENPQEDEMAYPPLTQFETRRAELQAQLTRVAELRAHLHAVEAARSSPSAETRAGRASGSSRIRPSELT